MIIREAEAGLTVIDQTDHASLCGTMAREWGNIHFAPVEPSGPVALAAAEHDNGWAEWEEDPRLNPETGRPYTYMDIPIEQHLEIYRRGIDRAVERDRYAGLLVSLHGSVLYSRYRAGQPGADEFVREQKETQRRLLGELRADPLVRGHCEPRVVRTNRDLLGVWDTLSLLLCSGEAWLEDLEVPCDYEGGRRRIRIAKEGEVWTLDPYPFDPRPLQLSIPVRRLEAADYDDEEELRRDLESANRVPLVSVLRPATA